MGPHALIGTGPAPFPSGAPAQFLLQWDTSQPGPEAIAPLPQDAAAIETARRHLTALRAEVEGLLERETKGLEDGLLAGFVVELDELADYVDGRLGGVTFRTDEQRSVAKARESLRRVWHVLKNSNVPGAASLARKIASLLEALDVIEFPSL